MFHYTKTNLDLIKGNVMPTIFVGIAISLGAV